MANIEIDTIEGEVVFRVEFSLSELEEVEAVLDNEGFTHLSEPIASALNTYVRSNVPSKTLPHIVR